MSLEESIKKYALQNAVQFNGKCNPGAVVGKILGEDPSLKKDMKTVSQKVQEIVKEVNLMGLDKQKDELENIDPSLLEKKKGEKKEGLKDLKEAGKNFKVRIAPSPSGPLHIGHAYGYSLNYEYAKKYNGKFVVRIEDTNPENIYDKAYELIEEDSNWLTENGVDEFYIQSSRLDIYYKYAEELVNLGKAYVCTCDADKWREDKNNGIACPCRDAKDHKDKYKKLFKGYTDGEAVLRLKTDIQHRNPAMRDFAIMRINEHVHPKLGKKQRVWPLMVLSVAVDDHEMGITHVLNGKDHADNAKKESIIMDYLGWRPPIYQHWGRINFEGFSLSSSKTKIAIEQNEYDGWDDIRLPFLPALRRRGYQADAFRKFAVEIGLSQNDKKVEIEEFWKNINTLNRQIIEPDAHRYFFVQDPIEIVVKDAPQQELELDLHPDNKKKGRKFKTGNAFFIQKEDFKDFENMETIRLMDCLNFMKKDDVLEFTSLDYETFKKEGNNIIHWLPDENNVDVEILMPDNETVKGIGESNLSKLKIGDIIQFERFGFCRLDSVEKNVYKFWFTHK